MIALLSQSIDAISEIDKKKISQVELIKKFPNTYQFCNKLLRKGVYSYEYMDSWEKFDEDKPPSQENYYSNLNLENITEEDCKHVDEVWDTFKIKNLGEYHDLYV